MVTTFLATMSFAERAAYAGRMALIGMATIFAALAILWGALELFRIALQHKNGEKTPKAAANTAKVTPAVSATPVTNVSAAPTTNDSEIVAAITAAVSLMLAEENGGVVPGFRVVSFRRTRGK